MVTGYLQSTQFNNWFCFLIRCIECVKSSPYLELANELEITKAITYLKEKDLAKVQTLANNSCNSYLLAQICEDLSYSNRPFVVVYVV